MRISVVIPALNEAASIGFVVSEMPWQLIDECIVVDNGSTDGTSALAEAAGARVVTAPRGYGSACMAGVAAASPASDIIVFMDGDGADVVSHLPELLAPIERDEKDFVLGTRLGRYQREPGSMLFSQVFAARFVGALLRVFYPSGFRYTDMAAFRAIRRSSLDSLHMQERTFGWNLEMQIKAIQHDLRIAEISVNYRARFGGVSKVSGDFKASLKAAIRIVQVLFRVSAQGKRAR
ncbi:MAG: glycosyltransferase family 2 protein [Janthinobacterium lividum]